MRILDLYIGRFTYHSASTTFITLAVFISTRMSAVIRFIEPIKAN